MFPFVALLYFGTIPFALPEERGRAWFLISGALGGVTTLAGFALLGASVAGGSVLQLAQWNSTIAAIAVLAVEGALALRKKK
jgi:hypothetical protein